MRFTNSKKVFNHRTMENYSKRLMFPNNQPKNMYAVKSFWVEISDFRTIATKRFSIEGWS